MSGEEAGALLCGDCLVDVEGRIGSDGARKVICPSCGCEDTLSNAIREAAQHELEKSIGGTFDGFKPTGAIKVRPRDSKRRFRFVTIDHS